MDTPINLTDYALAAWRTDGVEAACLALQDQWRVSVPLLLCCAWLQSRGRGLAPGSLATSAEAALAWEAATVGPLRTLRRSLKAQLRERPELAPLRNQIKAAEQAAELLLLADLQACSFQPGPQPALLALAQFYGLAPDCEPLVAFARRLGLSLNTTGPIG